MNKKDCINQLVLCVIAYICIFAVTESMCARPRVMAPVVAEGALVKTAAPVPTTLEVKPDAADELELISDFEAPNASEEIPVDSIASKEERYDDSLLPLDQDDQLDTERAEDDLDIQANDDWNQEQELDAPVDAGVDAEEERA